MYVYFMHFEQLNKHNANASYYANASRFVAGMFIVAEVR